jgi:dihydroorotate dehydrogenase electron transfer subunit
MAKSIHDFKIVDNKQLNDDFFILELLSSLKLPQILPGQFVQVRIEDSHDTFLRRPFSIHDVNYKSNTVKLLIQIKGNGTRALSCLRKGDNLNLVYPLGTPFSVPEKKNKVLVIGGGCGVAPMLFLAKYLKSNNYDCDILIGFRNKGRIIESDEYRKLGNVYITTEDGSAGEKGFVTQHSVLNNEIYSKLYCCGPDPMMRAVAKYASNNGIDCEVSLENLMACGIGVCLCCVVNTTRGNLCTCTEGPVFNIKELKW